MTGDLFLRRKWTLRAHGKQVVFVKRANERAEHVLMKAFLWAFYLPAYPDLGVEVSVPDRFKPDLVSLDPHGKPRFWGEAGHVSPDKIHSLVRRYRETHFALGKWDTPLDPFIDIVQHTLGEFKRSGPFDLLRFPADSAERLIGDRGEISVTHADLDWVRLS
jgi:hypothetical protein